MNKKQVRSILIGIFIAMAFAEIFIVLIGFKESDWVMKLVSSAFVTPAVGIVGWIMTATFVAGEDEDHAARYG